MPRRLHERRTITRRAAVRLGAGALGGLALSGCRVTEVLGPGVGQTTISLKEPTRTLPAGFSSIDVGDPYRNVDLYVPASYSPSTPTALVMMFHGAGGFSRDFLMNFDDVAEATGVALVGFSSFSNSWDAVLADKYSVDLDMIDLAIATACDFVRVDSRRVGLAGFSDGATYALGIGRANGEIFSRVAAFSPGYLLKAVERGLPSFFVTHGKQDPILDIDAGSREIVRVLRNKYAVEYHEFDGGHYVPLALATDAFHWLAAAR